MKIFHITYDGKIDSWGYVWAYTCFINGGLCVLPNVNLVSNIGFGENSLHTKDSNNILSNMEVKDIKNIIHPNFILVDQEADYYTSKICFGNRSIFIRIKNKILAVAKKQLVYFK